MDDNTNGVGLVSKASFPEVQYRFSRGHNAAKTATFPAIDNSDLDKLVTFLTNTVQPHTTEITKMFWCRIEICIWLAKESISERESDNHHEIDSSSTDWMVDADTIIHSSRVSHTNTNISEEEKLGDGSEYSMNIVHTRSASLHMREVVLSGALGGIPAHQAGSQHPGFSHHYLQVQIIATCEARGAA